jgi:hypothetical protein
MRQKYRSEVAWVQRTIPDWNSCKSTAVFRLHRFGKRNISANATRKFALPRTHIACLYDARCMLVTTSCGLIMFVPPQDNQSQPIRIDRCRNEAYDSRDGARVEVWKGGLSMIAVFCSGSPAKLSWVSKLSWIRWRSIVSVSSTIGQFRAQGCRSS